MAYSNWGAKVYRNGEPYPERCDVPVFREPVAGYENSGMAKFWCELIRLKEENKLDDSDFRLHPHHCVLGDGPVRLCGYKNWGIIYVIDSEKPLKTDLGWDEDWEETVHEGEVEYNGKRYRYRVEGGGNKILLRFEEPDGTIWEAVCGYEIGEGFEEWC